MCLSTCHIYVEGYTYLCSYQRQVWLPFYVFGFLNCSSNVCPSLPTMLKLPSVVECHVVDWWPYMDEGAIRCFLTLLPNVQADCLLFFITVLPFAPIPVYYTTLLLFLVLSNHLVLPGCPWVSCCLWKCLDAILTTDILNTFTQDLHNWYSNGPFGFCWMVLCFCYCWYYLAFLVATSCTSFCPKPIWNILCMRCMFGKNLLSNIWWLSPVECI